MRGASTGRVMLDLRRLVAEHSALVQDFEALAHVPFNRNDHRAFTERVHAHLKALRSPRPHAQAFVPEKTSRRLFTAIERR
jgi:hypothetical protein